MRNCFTNHYSTQEKLLFLQLSNCELRQAQFDKNNGWTEGLNTVLESIQPGDSEGDSRHRLANGGLWQGAHQPVGSSAAESKSGAAHELE